MVVIVVIVMIVMASPHRVAGSPVRRRPTKRDSLGRPETRTSIRSAFRVVVAFAGSGCAATKPHATPVDAERGAEAGTGAAQVARATVMQAAGDAVRADLSRCRRATAGDWRETYGFWRPLQQAL